MVLQNFTYYRIGPFTVLIIIGIVAYLSLLFTAAISIASTKKKPFLDFKWHPQMAKITVALATLHGLLAVLARF